MIDEVITYAWLKKYVDKATSGAGHITPGGEWSGDKFYKKGTIVSANNKIYIAIQDVPAGTELTNTAYWSILIENNTSIDKYDEAIKDIQSSLDSIIKETFETNSFKLTDFTYSTDGEWEVSNAMVSTMSGYNDPLIIHCAGKTLGFTIENRSLYFKLYINGNLVWGHDFDDTYTGPIGNTFTLPPTYMESDIVIHISIGDMIFSNMMQQSIKGVSELELKIGEIDTALDRILEIQNSLIGGEVV